MLEYPEDQQDETNAAAYLPIVVGAHLRAELEDRALAERVRQAAAERVATLEPVICTDLWYLNASDLQDRPTIAIGRPGLNAASAYFANRLPTVFVVESSYQVQMDPELIDLRACIWGTDAAANEAAAEAFITRYLEKFVEAAELAGVS